MKPMYSDVAESSFVVEVCGVSVRAYRAMQGNSALRTWVQLCAASKTSLQKRDLHSPKNLAWNNVEAVQNLDLALGGRDNRAGLSGALGIEPHWAEGERWSTAGFTESSALSEWPRDTFDTAAQ